MEKNRSVRDLPLGLMFGVDKRVKKAYLDDGDFGRGILVGMNLMRGITASFIMDGRLRQEGDIGINQEISAELARWSRALGIEIE